MKYIFELNQYFKAEVKELILKKNRDSFIFLVNSLLVSVDFPA